MPSDAGRKASYPELIGGRYFNVQLAWNKQIGNNLHAPGKARPKDPKDYRIVGQPIKRSDVAPRVFCQEPFVTDVRVPGMVHARMIRPPVAGATIVRVDDAPIKDVPGARVVRENNFLAVLADSEWDAIKAYRTLNVEWSNAAPPFPREAELYDHIRSAPVRRREDVKPAGNVEEAFRAAARVVEAEYEWPFQSHASMGPAFAVVEIKDGHVTCWSGSQKPHYVRDGIAATLGLATDKVDCIWVVGPGSYRRNDADDCAMDAAVLARAVERPVRVQYTREQGTGWDPKGPASIHRARAAIDTAGKVIAYEFMTRGFSRIDVQTNGSRPEDTLAGHFRGVPLKVNDNFGVPAESYEFANKRTGWETIAPLLDRASPLRSAHLRDPVRSADPLRQRIVHGRGGGGARDRPRGAAIAARQEPARHRRAQGCGREGGLAVAALAAARAKRQTPPADAASPTRSAAARPARSWPRSRSIAARAGSGRATSRWRTTAARSSIRTASGTPSRATSSRASAVRCGRRSNSTTRT